MSEKLSFPGGSESDVTLTDVNRLLHVSTLRRVPCDSLAEVDT